MTIDSIDGLHLRQAIIAGARRVILMQDNLNKINVFPVPDNDTGTNMALTMQSVAEGAISCQDTGIAGMSQCLADAALMGARGNSGAILAQFFYGFSQCFVGQNYAGTRAFAHAAVNARISAFSAMSEPREGTILTVIHDWAEKLKRHCSRSGDFKDLMREGLSAARRSLKTTPKKLKLLADAGVVDAGALGFVHLLEGVHNYMKTGKVDMAVGIGDNGIPIQAQIAHVPENITYQYCTECLISGSSIDHDRLRNELKRMGDSLIIAGSGSKVRIHIHTDEPAMVFSMMSKYGELSMTKFDDMRAQHHAAFTAGNATFKIAVVTDSSCDLPPEYLIRHNIQMVPVQVNFGSESYIDKITITPKVFYRKLETSKHHPTTSQPTPGEFRNTFKKIFGHYEQAVSIHLSGALSGTLRSAQVAAENVDTNNIRVVDSRNTCIALGLIVREAAEAIEDGCELDEVITRTQKAIDSVQFFVTFNTVDYLVRGGRLSKSRGLLAGALNIKPILKIDSTGRPRTIARTIGGQHALKKVMQLVEESASDKQRLRFAVAHTNAPEKAAWFSQKIRRNFKVRDLITVNASPALGVHAGPGAAGVAFWGE